jgi:hypothetical protein
MFCLQEVEWQSRLNNFSIALVIPNGGEEKWEEKEDCVCNLLMRVQSLFRIRTANLEWHWLHMCEVWENIWIVKCKV